MQKTTTDWDEIKSKVNSLEESLNKKLVLTPEEKHAVLRKRAQSIAQQSTDDTSDQEHIEVIEFRLGVETYALETEYVREVYLLSNYTPLPGLPDFILGITNIRGQIISIIDLKKLFNLPSKGIGELNKIIVVQNEKMEFGILSDIILGTYSIPLSAITSSYTNMTGIGAEYLKGVSSDHIIVIDAMAILNDEKNIINQ